MYLLRRLNEKVCLLYIDNKTTKGSRKTGFVYFDFITALKEFRYMKDYIILLQKQKGRFYGNTGFKESTAHTRTDKG